MDSTRRRFLQHAGLAAAAAAYPALTPAQQSFPSHPVRLILGFPAGGLSDIAARVISPKLSERLGQPIVIENRPGAVTNIATEIVLRSPADGYTLLMATVLNAINASVYEHLPFNFLRDASPIASILDAAFVLEVHPSVPARTSEELIAFARAHPGKLAVASAGVGSPEHVASELFKMMTGVEMLHVSYKGSAPAITDLIAGQVQVYFGPVAPSIDHIKNGRLRALAVTTSSRCQALPDVPPLAEVLPGFEVSAWHGLIAPRGTPDGVVQTLNNAVNAVLTDQTVQTRFTELGISPVSGTPGQFRSLITRDTAKWEKVVKAVGIKPEA